MTLLRLPETHIPMFKELCYLIAKHSNNTEVQSLRGNALLNPFSRALGHKDFNALKHDSKQYGEGLFSWNTLHSKIAVYGPREFGKPKLVLEGAFQSAEISLKQHSTWVDSETPEHHTGTIAELELRNIPCGFIIKYLAADDPTFTDDYWWFVYDEKPIWSPASRTWEPANESAKKYEIGGWDSYEDMSSANKVADVSQSLFEVTNAGLTFDGRSRDLTESTIYANTDGWIMLAEHTGLADNSPIGLPQVRILDDGEIRKVDGVYAKTFDDAEKAEAWINEISRK